MGPFNCACDQSHTRTLVLRVGGAFGGVAAGTERPHVPKTHTQMRPGYVPRKIARSISGQEEPNVSRVNHSAE